MKNFEEIFERPDGDEMMPVIVRFQSGGSNYDYIAAGLAAHKEVKELLRGAVDRRIVVWEPRCIIRYNKESGSLYGLAASGPVSGGYGVLLSGQPPAVIGVPLELIPCTSVAWEGIENWVNKPESE